MDINKLIQAARAHDLADPAVLADYFELLRLLEPDDPERAHALNREIRNISARETRQQHSVEMYELNKRSLLFDAQRDFDAYLQYVEFDRDPDKKFYLPRRRKIKFLVDAMQCIADHELDLLTISLPPGTGKSTLGIFLLSWLMGREPNKPNLASAHADKLTRSFFDGVGTIITDPEYLWHDVFPGVQLESTNAKDETINLDRPNRFKSLTCRSIDGSLTGATRCEGVLYADDLVSGIEEAMNIDRMNNLWVKYLNDLKSRKKEGCAEIHIATRWSVHDPIGRLEREYGDDPRCRFIAVPALDENGESNFDYIGGVGFSTAFFMDLKRTMDDASFRALFMNEPIEREGTVFKSDELNRYYELPDREPDAVVAICDTAEGGGDSTFLPVAYIYGDKVMIEDMVFDNGLPQVTVPLCAKMLVDHNVKTAQFESNSAGGGYADKVHDLVRELGGATTVTKKRTTANKLTKIIVNSGYIKEHFYFKDQKCYQPHSPYGRAMRELFGFTQAGKNKHDDVPDGLAQLSEFVQGLSSSKIVVFKRPF